VRRLTPQPVLGLDLLRADFPGATVADLPGLAKHLDAQEPLTVIELADVLIGPHLPATDVILIEKPSHLDRALALVGDHLGTPHDSRGRLRVDLGPLLELVLMLPGVDVVPVGILHGHHPITAPGRLDVLAPHVEGVPVILWEEAVAPTQLRYR
jgi:hypothetical protein